jgi:hypothetical protein
MAVPLVRTLPQGTGMAVSAESHVSHPQFLRWVASVTDEGHVEMLPIGDDQPDGFKSADEDDALESQGGCA